jgi:hypothetical protein
LTSLVVTIEIPSTNLIEPGLFFVISLCDDTQIRERALASSVENLVEMECV